MENQRIKVTYKDGITIVELLDEKIPKLDEAIVTEIAKSLFLVVEERAPVKMLLRFTRVKYLGSSVLGVLIRLKKRIAENGSTLKLCSINPSIYEMFVITGLDKIFDIYEGEEAALRQVGDF